MNAVLAAIGDELLSGVRQEKNAGFMAWHQHNKGVEVKAIEVISDEENEITNLLSRWVGRTDLLILSGGLGPTHDDKTRDSIAKYLGCELYSDPLYDKILERVKDNHERLARLEKSRSTQSMIPVKAQPVYNPTGSALGITFTSQNTKVIALPGVPMEYEAMTRQELPEIFSPDREDKHVWASVIILGLPEMAIAERIPEVIGSPALHVSILPTFPQVELIIRGKPEDVDKAEELTRSRFNDVLPGGCRSLAEAVLYEAKIKRVKISCSESCTGGLVGAALTDIAGSSESFMGSAVTYSNEAKQTILGVDENILADFGAVSEQCALSMARGSLRVYGSDYAVSITGIAGPDGGTDSKPVGTVWFGVASRESARAFMKVLPGSRGEIRTRAVRFALAELWRTLHNKIPDPKL
ncbi:MAG: nicotinamide-nucleotide amidohydrolase family protein [Synergistaceae bacterium]|nr:nicotinamide-nucleotide amidohydrolase family protein [Synergistaceae bacterium]